MMSSTAEWVPPAGLSPDAARVFADLLDEVSTLRLRAEQLEGALESRIAIEQAKGVLAERFGLDVESSFDILRRASRHHRLTLHSLARRVVESESTPPEIEATLARSGQAQA